MSEGTKRSTPGSSGGGGYSSSSGAARGSSVGGGYSSNSGGRGYGSSSGGGYNGSSGGGYGTSSGGGYGTSNGSLYGSTKLSGSSKTTRTPSGSARTPSGSSRTPSGFVSYQIPHGQRPSDNINLNNPRRYYSANNVGRTHHRHHNRQNSDNGDCYTTGADRVGQRSHAGIHPSNLQNGGRPFSVQLGVNNRSNLREDMPEDRRAEDSRKPVVLETYESYDRNDYEPPPWARPTKVYPRSPLPKQRIHEEEDSDLNFDRVGKPPIHPMDVPKPPPRNRPRSWTSTLFNAFRGGSKNSSTTLPHSSSAVFSSNAAIPYSAAPYPPSLPHSSTFPATVPVLMDVVPSNTSTLDRRQFGPKQVRFLANPCKNIEPNPKFYSLPRFIQPVPEKVEKVNAKTLNSGGKTRSRTPSPFGRFVKSLVRGNNVFVVSHIFMLKNGDYFYNIMFVQGEF